MITIDLKELYGETAKLAELDSYTRKALELAGEGQEVVLTGAAPVWLYLTIAHALHGRAKRLIYRAAALKDEKGEQVDVGIFDHNAF